MEWSGEQLFFFVLFVYIISIYLCYNGNSTIYHFYLFLDGVVILVACLSNEFQCSNDVCIPRVAVCDNVTDCETGEDEASAICQCEPHQVSCCYTSTHSQSVTLAIKQCVEHIFHYLRVDRLIREFHSLA